MKLKIQLPTADLRAFCQRWKITELAIFGSALREDFGPHSDVDVLATFAPDSEWGLFDHVRMEEELKRLVQRDVDIVSRCALERSANWIRRREILNSAETVYAAG
jgi:predicted nucleotidyltransferase